MYCDVSVDENGKLTIDTVECGANFPADESLFVCHKGYISLFPFLLGLLEPESPHLASIMHLIRDPPQLWSPYCIRSSSNPHPLLAQAHNYSPAPTSA